MPPESSAAICPSVELPAMTSTRWSASARYVSPRSIAVGGREKAQAVELREARESIGPFQKLIAKPGLPADATRRQIRNRSQAVALRIGAAHQDGGTYCLKPSGAVHRS